MRRVGFFLLRINVQFVEWYDLVRSSSDIACSNLISDCFLNISMTSSARQQYFVV